MKEFTYANLVSVLTKIQTKINNVLSKAESAQSTADTNASNISTLQSSVTTNTSNIATNTSAISELNENSLSVKRVLNANDDLNELTDTGIYGWLNTSAPSNSPLSGVHGFMQVVNIDSMSFVFQQVFATGLGSCYIRRKLNSSWGSWIQWF